MLVLLSVGVPQGDDDLRRDQVAGVEAEHAQEEDAVVAKELADEVVDQRLLLGGEDLREFQVFPHKAGVVLLPCHAMDPQGNAERGEQASQHDPEPQEDVDFLVQHVHRQHALCDHVVVAAEVLQGDVAEADTGKDHCLLPSAARHNVAGDVDAEVRVVGAEPEEALHEVDLPDGVGQVHELGDHVKHDQPGADPLREHAEAAHVLQSAAQLSAGAVPMLAVVEEHVLQCASHMSHQVVAVVLRLRIDGFHGPGDQMLEVRSGPVVGDHLPEDARKVEHDALHAEDEGNPLVVIWKRRDMK